MRTWKRKHPSHTHLLNPSTHEEEIARSKQSNYEYQLIIMKEKNKTKKTTLTKWLPTALRYIRWFFDRLNPDSIFFVGVEFNFMWSRTMLMQLSLIQKGNLKIKNTLVTVNPHTATNLTILALYEPVSNPLKSVKLLAVINCLVFYVFRNNIL